VFVALAGAAGWFYLRVQQPYRGYSGSEQFVEIPAGAGSRTIGDRLVAAGVVRDEVTYRLALWLSGKGRRLEAGEYRFDTSMTPIAVIDKLARGDVYVINLTFPEGLSVAEMAKIADAHGFGPASAFESAARDLEGYLFPDTYPLPRRTDAAKLVRMMTAQFDHVVTPDLRRAAEAKGLSLRQVVTLASIVEKETAKPDERPVVAAVYGNRLRIGMALQCDPTVIYALERARTYTGNLRRDDLTIDSPYNTYRYPGLPPGPIASPGRAALDAALHPASAEFLYFVSRNDGTHVFAKTLEEHNRNVQKYQVQYFRDQRAGRAGGAGGAGQAGRSGRR
jgi:UPF0755 protein